MMNFKNTKTAKVVSGFVGIATAVMMMGPVVASADTVADLTAQINALLAQVSALQAAQSSSTTETVVTSGGFTFTETLTVGSKGSQVTELQQMLVAKGFLDMPTGVAYGYFGSLTKTAVAAWQAANGITPAVGYFGPISRAEANKMSSSTTTTTTSGFPAGCTSAVGFSTITGTSCASGAMVSYPAGCSSTVGFSPTTGQSCGAGTTAISGTGVTAVLDAASPMNQTLITPQGVATLAIFKLVNGGSAPAKVTMLKFQRTGISSDATVNNVYLYQGSDRLTDSSSISQGFVNFSDAAGLVTVPAMGSVSVSVRGDIASGVNGQVLGMMLVEATTDAGAVSGLPVSGDSSTFATAPSGITTADFTGSFSPTSGSIDPQSDYVVWQKNLQIGNRDAVLKSVRFQQIGSVYASDVTNLRLMIDGTQVGTAVAQADVNRFVTFTFDTPLTVKSGNHTLKVMADIVGGSGRNFNFSLRRVVDVEILDSQLGVVVTPTVNAGTFTTTGMQSTTAVSINAGTLTVTKDTTSPSGNVVLNGSSVSLAKFVFRAQGEDLKVENLTFGYTTSDGSWGNVRSSAVYADGVQIGSTADMVVAGTQFNLGSSLILTAGKDVVVEVRGDVFDNDGTNHATAGDTLTVNLVAGSANVYQRASLGYIGNVAISGNSLTVAEGSIALAKYTAYANQTVTVPQSAYKLGEFRLTAGSSEGVNLDTITLALPTAVADIAVSNMTNLYVVYGTKTSTSKASGASSQTFSINEPLAANGTMSFAVYANISATPATGSTTVATLTVSGTSQSSGQAVASSAVVGQTITVGAGTLSAALDASTPVAALVVANSMPKVASFKFSALNDAFTITKMTATTTNSTAISQLIFKDGATTIATVPFNGVVATATFAGVSIPYNSNKIIDVYANLGSVGTGFGTSTGNVGVALVGYEKNDSNGVTTLVYLNDGAALNGNSFYAYKTKPTITNVALPTTVLNAGTMTVAKFTVTADAGGTLAWRKLVLNTSSSTGVTATGFAIYDSANESTALTGVVATVAAGVVTFTSASQDQEVSGSKTYVVKATLGGNIISGASLTSSIPSSSLSYAVQNSYATVAGTAATFVWSDEGVLGHSATTADWSNDYLVKNIPTDSQALTK